LPILSNLAVVLVLHVRKIVNYLQHSRKPTDVIESETVRYVLAVPRATSPNSLTSCESECDRDAEDKESVHRTHHHGLVAR